MRTEKDIIYVDFGTESYEVPFDIKDIKRITSLDETINDPILKYLYILKGNKYFFVKAPIENAPGFNLNYLCILTKTSIFTEYYKIIINN